MDAACRLPRFDSLDDIQEIIHNANYYEPCGHLVTPKFEEEYYSLNPCAIGEYICPGCKKPFTARRVIEKYESVAIRARPTALLVTDKRNSILRCWQKTAQTTDRAALQIVSIPKERGASAVHQSTPIHASHGRKPIRHKRKGSVPIHQVLPSLKADISTAKDATTVSRGPSSDSEDDFRQRSPPRIDITIDIEQSIQTARLREDDHSLKYITITFFALLVLSIGRTYWESTWISD